MASQSEHQRTVRLPEALLEVELPWQRQFDDPRREWRRLFAELLGTFFLVLVAAGASSVASATGEPVGRAAAVSAPGLMVMVIILFMGAVSGAHLNPVVSLAFALRGDFPWRRVPGYVLCQLSAAALAALFLHAVLDTHGALALGATVPAPGIGNWQALFMETVLTAGLVSTIGGTASSAQNVGPLSALAVGGYIVLAGLWASPVSGASMNPARSFGPDLVARDFHAFWVYVAGPLAGGLLAVGAGYVLRGPGGTPVSARAAQGTLEPPVVHARPPEPPPPDVTIPPGTTS